MSHVSKTPFDLTMHLVSVGGNSDGGWIPGNGFPNPQVGRIGQRYVDVQSGHVYGPKTRSGWPADPTHTLNLGNVAGEFANMLSRVPALEVRATNLEARTKVLEERADAAADLAIEHRVSLQDHGLRIEILEADNLEIRRRLGMADDSLSARMLAAEDALNDLASLRTADMSNVNSRLSTLTTELAGNSSSLQTLQESYTSMTQTWTQEVTTLRSEFNGNVATLEQTLRTHATRHNATAEQLTTLASLVGNNQAAITAESRTRANQYSALAEQVTTLSAQTASSNAALTSQQTAMATELEAYASSVLALDAELGETKASFQEEVETLATADEALARRVSTLDVAAEGLVGRISAEESARISGDSAVLTSARQLIATSESGTSTRISQEAAARLSGDQAEAYQRSLLDTKFTNQGTTLQAAITAEKTARTSAIAAETTARNQQVSTLNSNIGQVSAAVTSEAQTRATVDGYLGSQFTLETAVNAAGKYAVSGLKMSATSAAGSASQTEFAIYADRFTLSHTSGVAGVVPFRAEGGIIYINSAMIQHASIDNAHIKDAAITSAKIREANVDTLRIAGNAVTVPVVTNTNGTAPSASIYMEHPGTVLAIGAVNFLAGNGGEGSVGMDINGRGGVAISLANSFSGALSTAYGFPVSAGWTTFTVAVTHPAHIALGNCSLILMGAKR